MRTFITQTCRFLMAALMTGVFLMPSAHADGRVTKSFDADWRFLQGDPDGAAQSVFNDSSWRRLDVPHDWSIEGPFAPTNKTGGAGGFLPSGVGWYRKHFTLSGADKDRAVFIEFDGVMQDSEVWINGHSLGKRPYGYVSFGCELTGHLKFGDSQTNVLAVRADTSEQPASRWYSGAGIYRHVRLVITDPVHVERWGTFVTTPDVSEAAATVRVECSVTNQSSTSREVELEMSIINPDGRTVQTKRTPVRKLAAARSETFQTDLEMPKPRRWSLEDPALYRAVVTVHANGEALDHDEVSFGIREFAFSPTNGFSLNGRNFKLYGVCLHHDGSAFGAAVPLGVWERRLKALRELGCNAIRTAHNPPAPEFLDLCDRMGFLVMDEFFDCWTVGKNRYDYHLYFDEWSHADARDTILRDRNHPSVILWSVGNEIHDTPKEELAKRILKGLVEVCHQADPTRPVTQALFRPNVSHDYDNGLADMLDVIGTNYRDNELLEAQRKVAMRKIVGTEQRHDRQTWLWCRDNISHSGQFLWTGVDYLGESRRWPVIAAGSGVLDRTGEVRPLGYQRQSWWSGEPMVFLARRQSIERRTGADPGFAPLDRRQTLFADWSPANTEPHDENVEVYSNCEQVELFLNGKSLGSKPINADASPRNWDVPFRSGRLQAVARNQGRAVARAELRTAGDPARIQLEADVRRLGAGWDDVSYVKASVVDRNGVLVPGAANEIHFNVTGDGVIAAVDSADNASHEPFQATSRSAYQGTCFAIVKATASRGRIHVTATAEGLRSGSISLQATGQSR